MAESRIWILPTEVAEQIAAGEVVERPASVVKELVENALDAGARRVTVETEAGGKGLIRVTDDGGGMTPEEAAIAIQRHATSKIRSAEDLFNIHTLGFRGEALPSIAAVSEFEILTRTPDEAEGTRILIEGGVIQRHEAASAPVGTTMTVQRLFYNVPVREKFLRSDTTEAAQITDWLQRLALSRPDVSFRLVHDGREALLSAGSQEPLNAVVAVLGRGVAREMLRVGKQATQNAAEAGEPFSSGIQVTGFVGRPTLTRANRSLQHFYVNGRAVRSPLFYRALDDAFRSTMPHGRYPVALLFLQVPPDVVDVNVHPAKIEVRFQDESAVHRAVLQAVQEALRSDAPRPEQYPLLTEQAPQPADRVAEPAAAMEANPLDPAAGPLSFANTAIGGPTPQERYRTWGRAPGAGGQGNPVPPRVEVDPFEEPGDVKSATQYGFRPSGPAVPRPFAEGQFTSPTPAFTPRPQPPQPAPVPESSSEPAIPELHLLGQAQDLFILAEGGGRFWVIDQHVAHERVLFDRLTAPGTRGEPSEALLIPATLEVGRGHALALEDHRELLSEWGFDVEPFGPSRYVLRAVPRSLLGRNYEAVFRDLADELAERSHGGQVRLRKEEVAMAAAGRSCKSAIKAGQKQSDTEMRQLLADLRQARNPYTCPHGRPVFLNFDPTEVAALFGSRTCE